MSLNLCYAGRCSSTCKEAPKDYYSAGVSIFVMLDDALVLEKQRLY